MIRVLHDKPQAAESYISSLIGNEQAQSNQQQCICLWQLNVLSQLYGPADLERIYQYAQNSLQNSCSQAQFYLSVKLMMNVVDIVKCGQVQDGLELSEPMKVTLMRSL